MFGKFVRLALLLPLAALITGVIVASIRPATAAPPDEIPRSIGSVAQEAGVTLEKEASRESVPLGQSVAYTITIQNNSDRSISAEMVDELPVGLSMLTQMIEGRQTTTISATVGQADFVEGAIVWDDTLEPGQAVEITYPAVPPSTSQPGESLENIAVVAFGDRILEAAATISTTPPDLGLWGRFVNLLASILVTVDGFLLNLGVPYAFGFSIILFTVAVRLATFPLNMQQIKSSKAMQALQPKMKEIQEKHKNDREALAKAQMDLYREHGVNPLGGCFPILVQMPIWFALYRALLQLSQEGLLGQGFFWIPSLGGPVADYTGGLSWLWPLPPAVGWPDAIAYMILPVLLVVSQLYMQKMLTPPPTDPQQASMHKIMQFMPLMFGYFALIVPSGLTLYWFTSNILAMGQQYFTKTHLQGADDPKKSGAVVSTPISETPVPANSTPSGSAAAMSGESEKGKNDRKRRKSRKRRK